MQMRLDGLRSLSNGLQSNRGDFQDWGVNPFLFCGVGAVSSAAPLPFLGARSLMPGCLVVLFDSTLVFFSARLTLCASAFRGYGHCDYAITRTMMTEMPHLVWARPFLSPGSS